jgi:hypothetical protein
MASASSCRSSWAASGISAQRTAWSISTACRDGPTPASRIAKGLFYHDRTFDRVLGHAAEQGVCSGEIEALRAWLPHGRVDQKREDALGMLEAMKTLLAGNPEPVRVNYALEWTEVWDDAIATSAASARPGADGSPAWISDDRILEELRLEPDMYAAVHDRALLRLLAVREVERRCHALEARTRRDLLGRLRARHGLFTRAALDRWLEANALDSERLERMVEDEARLEAIGELAAPTLHDALLDELRLRDHFTRFAERARDKQVLLEGQGLDHPGADGAQSPAAALRAWYFEQCLNRPLPDDIDAAARELGFANRADLDRALRREWLYCRARARSFEISTMANHK